MLLNDLMNKLDEKKDRIIEIRRYLHEHPELLSMKRKHLNILLIFIKKCQLILWKQILAANVVLL